MTCAPQLVYEQGHSSTHHLNTQHVKTVAPKDCGPSLCICITSNTISTSVLKLPCLQHQSSHCAEICSAATTEGICLLLLQKMTRRSDLNIVIQAGLVWQSFLRSNVGQCRIVESHQACILLAVLICHLIGHQLQEVLENC